MADFISSLGYDFTIWELLFILLTTLCAGIIDAIAGGGGLLTVPALLMTGIDPLYVLGTNKFQSSFGSFSSSFYFIKNGIVSVKSCVTTVIYTFIGAALGVVVANYISDEGLNYILPYLLFIIGLCLLFLKLPEHSALKSKISYGLFSLIFGLGIGFYDGFFGPGTGTFWSLSYIFIMGYSTIKAVAHTKIMNFTSNIVSLLMFAYFGKILFVLGILMALVQIVGANIGARVALKGGVKVIKPLLIIVSFSMVVKVVYSNESHPLHIMIAGIFN